MKKSILITSMMLSITTIFAQQTNTASPSAASRSFKLDAALGYAVPLTSGIKGGFLLAVEPKYFVTPSLSLGLRIEGAFKARGIKDANNNAEYTKQLTTSAIVTGNYYFIKIGEYKQFVGIGTGIYNVGKFDVAFGDYTIEAKAYQTFGAMARLGFEYKFFNFGIEYNMLSKTPATSTNIITKVANDDVVTKNSYVGMKAGFTFGK